MEDSKIKQAYDNILKSFEYAIITKEQQKSMAETPARATKALLEMVQGYKVNIPGLFKTFDDNGKDQFVIAKNIEFTSLCEHHLLPFFGTAHIAYLPQNKVIGASKLPRILLAYAQRFQLQERITEQVASCIMEYLKPRGVAVIIEATHMCMKCRGVKSNSTFVTSVMLGVCRTDPSAKQEVLALLGVLK